MRVIALPKGLELNLTLTYTLKDGGRNFLRVTVRAQNLKIFVLKTVYTYTLNYH